MSALAPLLGAKRTSAPKEQFAAARRYRHCAGAKKEGDQTLPHHPLNNLKAALHLCKGGRVIVEGFG
jgi:hypothetical protein